MDTVSTVFSRDRRFSQRHNVKTALRVRVWKSGLPEKRAESVNLSQRGILFASNSRIPEGEVVEILLKMPEEVTGQPTTEWRCTGQVARVELADSFNGKFGVGVQFIATKLPGSSNPVCTMFQDRFGICLFIMNVDLQQATTRTNDCALCKERSMKGSKKPANGQPVPGIFSVHPKLFVFFDKRTGTPRFQVRARHDGTLPVEQAVSLPAVQCIARQKMPREFGILVGTDEDLVGRLVGPTMKVIEGCSNAKPQTSLSLREDQVLVASHKI